MSQAKPKILCLHGYTQNAAIFRKRLASLRKQLTQVEMVFVDAPLVVKMPTDNNLNASALDSTATSADATNPDEIPRGWWIAKGEGEQKTYQGFAESLLFLRKTLSEGNYIGVLGFSQGAACASLLQSSLYTDPDEDIKPLDFSIIVGGFRAVDHALGKYYPISPLARSLHVIGLRDMIVDTSRSEPLVKEYNNPRVETHPGGHFVPSTAVWRKFLNDYIESRGDSGHVPSPTPGDIKQSNI